MGEVWDIGKSTKKGIILNSHARTGLYKSWQIIVDNYIKQDRPVYRSMYLYDQDAVDFADASDGAIT